MQRQYRHPLSDRRRLAMLALVAVGDPEPTAVLTVSENTTDETKYNVSTLNSILANGTPINTTTPGTSATIRYQIYIDGVLQYDATIDPNTDATVIGNWTYNAGARNVTQFQNEIVAFIDAGGTGVTWTFSKLDWAHETGYIQNFSGENDPKALTFQAVITDVLATKTATSPQRVAPIKAREGRLTNPHYLQIDPNGEIFVSDFTNHAIRRLVEDADYQKLRITTISGEEPRTATSGFTPTAGATVDGNAARHNRPEGLRFETSGTAVNGYLPLWGIDRTNKQYYRITRKASTNADDEGVNWETEDLTISNSSSFPGLTIDPTRRVNGEPIFYDGAVGLDIYYYDGANWTTTNIFPLTFVSGVNGIAFDGNGDLYVCYFDGSTPYLARVELTGADPTNAADWTLREVIKTGSNFTEWYDVTNIGNDANGKPQLVLPYSTYDEIYLFTHNGGATNTAADWDETLIATIPSPVAATYPVGVEYDSLNNRVVMTGFLTHEIWQMTLDFYNFSVIAGVEETAGYENSTRY